MNKKRKRVIVGAIICVLLIGMSVAFIYVAKYKEEHRYLTYAELPDSQIVFIKALTEDYENVLRTNIQAIDVSGRVYSCILYGEDFELSDSTYLEIIENNVEKDIIDSKKVQEMYGDFLRIDRDAEYEIVSDTFVLDSGTNSYYGIRFQENGEVDYVLLWSRGEPFGQGILSGAYVKDICKWLENP